MKAAFGRTALVFLGAFWGLPSSGWSCPRPWAWQ